MNADRASLRAVPQENRQKVRELGVLATLHDVCVGMVQRINEGLEISMPRMPAEGRTPNKSEENGF
jgi:hypothetical protein